jgi:hypothetical protein
MIGKQVPNIARRKYSTKTEAGGVMQTVSCDGARFEMLMVVIQCEAFWIVMPCSVAV